MPEVFTTLRDLDMRRIKGYQSFMRRYVEIEREVEPIISKCLDGIVTAADSIEEDEVRFRHLSLRPEDGTESLSVPFLPGFRSSSFLHGAI
jgi:hypothetical protein